MNIRKIDDRFAIAGQVQTDEVKKLAEDGFRAIICARPDNEDPDQPSFEAIATIAQRFGMKAFHIPVTGLLSEGQIIQMEQALANTDGPIIGYCRSGGRAGSLYQALAK